MGTEAKTKLNTDMEYWTKLREDNRDQYELELSTAKIAALKSNDRKVLDFVASIIQAELDDMTEAYAFRTFNNHPVVSLVGNGHRPFSFGLQKAHSLKKLLSDMDIDRIIEILSDPKGNANEFSG